MVDFLKEILDLVAENDVPTAIITAFTTIVSLVIYRTKLLKQTQRYLFLVIIFFGTLLFLTSIYAISTQNDKKVDINNSVKDVNDSNISIGGVNTSVDKSIKGVNNSTITIGR